MPNLCVDCPLRPTCALWEHLKIWLDRFHATIAVTHCEAPTRKPDVEIPVLCRRCVNPMCDQVRDDLNKTECRFFEEA